MVKVEKKQVLNAVHEKLYLTHQNKKYILPNKDLKKLNLDRNKVWKSEGFFNYI